jgi:uncharacterized protein
VRKCLGSCQRDKQRGNARQAKAPSASTGTPLSAPATAQAREALDHYNQAIERLKSGDWAGFGTQLDAMRGLLETLSGQSIGQ